ncbi:hypothetical protein D9M72_451990 [compost metagenome]
MPVGREALDAVEGGRRDVGHHLERQIGDAQEGEVPEYDRAERERHQHPECGNRRIPGKLIGCPAGNDGVDKPAGIERRQDVGER